MDDRQLHEKNAEIARLRDVLEAAFKHLEYCGYGDSWERECAESEGLPTVIESALGHTKEVLDGKETPIHEG